MEGLLVITKIQPQLSLGNEKKELQQ